MCVCVCVCIYIYIYIYIYRPWAQPSMLSIVKKGQVRVEVNTRFRIYLNITKKCKQLAFLTREQKKMNGR